MNVQTVGLDSSVTDQQEITLSTTDVGVTEVGGQRFDENEKKILDYDALYELVNQKAKVLFSETPYEEKDVQHPSLDLELRSYQAKAVNWMISKETTSDIKGGILADEMGLGKTVEVLALILNRPRGEVNIPNFLKLEPGNAEVKVIYSTAANSDKPSKSKKRKISSEHCLKCSEENFRQLIEKDWRSSPDKAKATIQAVIDQECGFSQSISKKGKKLQLECTCNLIRQLSTKQRLQFHYENALSEYSCLNSFNPKQKAEDHSQILCVCGDITADKTLVECLRCKTMQHASCVNYDVNCRESSCYYCPQCWVTFEPIKSSATLIITPASISQQWADEIRHHLRKPLNVLIYQGVRGQGYHQPMHLAKHYDVIIASYETLRKELYFAEITPAEKRGRRKAACYMAPPSPLMSVEFWRVCLDEAQMAEGSQTQAAKMARKFQTVHRWCVTGTPIQKSVYDLYGLLLFLGIEVPKISLGNASALTDILASIFWRTRKSMVTDQIHLPEQKEHVQWLSFSAVEEEFYREQETVCVQDFFQRLDDITKKYPTDLDVKLSSIDSHRLKVLLNPLLRLRQACVHPQMVRGRFLNIRVQTRTMTMEELLVSLISRAQLECEESHRRRIAAANGLAALHVIKEEWASAAEKYREVLRWSEEIKDFVKTDTLQTLHAMHNLSDVLHAAPDGTIPPTLRDSSLVQEVEQLRQEYMEQAFILVKGAQSNLALSSATVATLTGELDSLTETLDDFWWNALLLWAAGSSLAEKLVEDVNGKLRNEADYKSTLKQKNSFGDFRSIDDLRSRLLQRLEEISEQRTKVGQLMRLLEVTSIEKLANEAADCHLRPLEGRQRRYRCQLCRTGNEIESYESLLFRMNYRQNLCEELNSDEDEVLATNGNHDYPVIKNAPISNGSWYSQVERLLKHMLDFAKKHHPPPLTLRAGKKNLDLINAKNTEFSHIRDLWKKLNDQAAALDELSMATIRLRLRLPHELPQPKSSGRKSHQPDASEKHDIPLYLLERHEVEIHNTKCQGDLLSATNELKKHMGRASYLKNLAKSGYGKTGNQNVEPCPLCTNPLGYMWSALPCAHCFCISCIQQLIKGAHSLKCGICRAPAPLREITYVNAISSEIEEDQVKVIGSHSTKVEAVIRKLLIIRSQDSTAKCLVFSTWIDVLRIIGRALDENRIPHCTLVSNKGPQQLSKFKSDPSVVALLIPVNSGANGLNLTEATHIILVEPILNPGNELQAIGRIHRIGQTKPTFVHKILINNTIEEKMAAMLNKHRSARSALSAGSIKENPVTVADLKSLFSQEPESGVVVL